MAGTFVKARFHFVWSTRRRYPFLTKDIRPRLWGYFSRVVQDHSGILFDAGGVLDHVHLYLECPRTMAVADLASIIKTTSSKWLRQTFENCKGFYWQEGYAAFSVNPADDVRLRDYIRNQEGHHQTRPFECEYRKLLDRNHLQYEERYLFG